ncbi:PREDICTED: vacuolar-processing enzyme delta-isozyme isoform X2 [Brassica oleracea var. oleracea]|uniref:vacuolar-processing enzyme delta-isozyme isoform X2 n=1 Tax=Brassica oleracea var. oleracea TaxID=109376 RepID=UPI0006A6B5E6|nr:PREDICTED: vacuolar-processing enzyme delta-isozyme isoform X2 [Brassica oleracea var. oleracea]
MSSLGHLLVLVFLYVLLFYSADSRKPQVLHDTGSSEDGAKGTRWAVLIAGSSYYYNYRHQADICHAYQVLRKGGLKDENIIVFMYDDIAFNPENPRPGVIINRPDGGDVYEGVPKDYTEEAVNVKNFYNVILGNESGITGGSGKVVKSGPNDSIFIYYADHGAPGLLSMPDGEDIHAKDFIKVLEKMHKLKRYKKMVIYVEACESGSMFEGILKTSLNILAVTASNATESSFGIYCPGEYPPPPPEYNGVCLGDTFSVSWLEDSELHDMSKETLKQQYQAVKRRTGPDAEPGTSSHVSRFGSKALLKDYLVSYIGTNPQNENFTSAGFTASPISNSSSVNTRDIPLLYLKSKIRRSPMESPERQALQKKLFEEMNHRRQIDQNIVEILKLSLKQTNVLNLLISTRTTGQPLVDDWDCFKTLVNSFKNHCGATMDYGLKYTGALANICNMGVDVKQTVSAIEHACNQEKRRNRRSETNIKASLLSGELSDGRRRARDQNSVPRGHLAVYVGDEMQRFVIPTKYLQYPEFKVLMEEVADEFGYEHEGGIHIPCEESVFEEILIRYMSYDKKK